MWSSWSSVEPGPPETPPSDDPSGGWTRLPLIALAIVSFGPSVMTPILYLALRLVGVRELHGTEIIFNRNTLGQMANYVGFAAFSNWPFIVLYNVCKARAKEEWPDVRSVQLAMWCSLTLMFFLNFIFFYYAVDMLAGSPFGKGEDPIGVFVAWIPFAILGVVGWFAGRFFAWAT
jgi:hypothetical protein